MIKDKITPELRSRFIEDIRISKETGKERGFFLCENKKGNLIPSKSCEGTECDIQLENPITGCLPEKTYGEFHTHPYLYSAKRELKSTRQKILPREELKLEEELRMTMDKNIRTIHERITKVKGITINTPSYTDILKALLAKSINITNGTVCTSTDVDTSRVECWTIKDLGKDKLKKLAIVGMVELEKVKPKGSSLIKKWIDNVSERETIEL